MNTKYFDIDSTYRNRELWPIPAEFEIPVSTLGTKPICQALDPVALSAPLITWKSNDFNMNPAMGGSSADVRVTVTPNACDIGPIFNTNDNTTFIVTAPAGQLQPIENYYRAAKISNHKNGMSDRIVAYRFLGTDGFCDRAQITVANGINISAATAMPSELVELDINDPTDFTYACNSLVFVPNGRIGSNAYPNMYLYNETRNESRVITDYQVLTHILEIDRTKPDKCGYVDDCTTEPWSPTDTYSIRSQLPSYEGKIARISNGTKIVMDNNVCYECAFLRISDTASNSYNEYRRITGCCCLPQVQDPTKNDCALVICDAFGDDVVAGTDVEILPISYDNAVPFSYNGTWIQEEACYEIRIVSLVLPNSTLIVGQGSRIAFYPFVYVEFSNLGTSGKNINQLYSNNPHSSRALFRVPITDTTNALTRPFILLASDVQVIKFKPNDSLRFRVTLGDGSLYQTVVKENYSPLEPNPDTQIRAVISMRRI